MMVTMGTIQVFLNSSALWHMFFVHFMLLLVREVVTHTENTRL